jgi:hypothetical protein
MAFYSETNSSTKYMNQVLELYLYIFIDYAQDN